MVNILGFGREKEKPEEKKLVPAETAAQPVKSLARVRFPDRDCSYAYYNDRFDLHEGDLVFVSGKLAGVCGVVESVTRKFKIDLKQYERVIAQPTVRLCGSYAPILDKMVSFDAEAVSPELFRSWVKPPIADDDENKPEYALGEGYAFDLAQFEESADVKQAILERAAEYCGAHRVCYLSVRDGVGTAFVEGSKWYELNFRFENGHVSELYCECPYAGLCKHSLAVLITLRMLAEKTERCEFTALDRGFFYRMLSLSGQAVTV